jgi:hypothetical protein
MPTKAKLRPYRYDLAYGKDSEAGPGRVLFKIADGEKLIAMSLPPEEFMNLVHAISQVALAVQNDLDGKPYAY